MIHVGKEIEKVFTKKGIKISVFASKLNTVPRNVYNIFTRESIDTEILFKISLDLLKLFSNDNLINSIILSCEAAANIN